MQIFRTFEKKWMSVRNWIFLTSLDRLFSVSRMCLCLVFLSYSGYCAFLLKYWHLSLKVALSAVWLVGFISKKKLNVCTFYLNCLVKRFFWRIPLDYLLKEIWEKRDEFIRVTIHWDCLSETFCRSSIHQNLRHLNLTTFKLLSSC